MTDFWAVRAGKTGKMVSWKEVLCAALSQSTTMWGLEDRESSCRGVSMLAGSSGSERAGESAGVLSTGVSARVLGVRSIGMPYGETGNWKQSMGFASK